jgi:LmbE family N-acetylglucosaminyl deacetylase
MINVKRTLLISPHSDDIELGAGGTVSRLLRDRCEIRWVVVGQPEESRLLEQRAVFEDLGVANFEFYGYGDRFLELDRGEILDRLDAERDTFQPDLVIGPPNDLHQDHRTVFNEMSRAFRTSGSLICYEPWMNQSFSPQFYVSIEAADLAAKQAMVGRYTTQNNKVYTDVEYLRCRAVLRGAQCDSEFAEAFEIVRWIS